MSPVEVGVRRGTHDDLDAVVDAIALAFQADPVWRWVFPDDATRVESFRAMMPVFVETSLRNDSLWVTEDCSAVSVWTPPGCPELDDSGQLQFLTTMERLLGARAQSVVDGFLVLDSAHPRDMPHHYLGFLATHPRARGSGLGMALVRTVLERIDEEGLPAYLESSNPANHARYERAGFHRRDSVAIGDGAPPFLTMLRPAQESPPGLRD
jgi:ribosomal protein S18 acetylase RimI-like enzyme